MIIIAAVGPSPVNVVIAIAIVGRRASHAWCAALTLDIRTRDYIRAAETAGRPHPLYIMFVEILPQRTRPADH
jgi:peptide/nickel transport system permease protein